MVRPIVIEREPHPLVAGLTGLTHGYFGEKEQQREQQRELEVQKQLQEQLLARQRQMAQYRNQLGLQQAQALQPLELEQIKARYGAQLQNQQAMAQVRQQQELAAQQQQAALEAERRSLAATLNKLRQNDTWSRIPQDQKRDVLTQAVKRSGIYFRPEYKAVVDRVLQNADPDDAPMILQQALGVQAAAPEWQQRLSGLQQEAQAMVQHGVLPPEQAQEYILSGMRKASAGTAQAPGAIDPRMVTALMFDQIEKRNKIDYEWSEDTPWAQKQAWGYRQAMRILNAVQNGVVDPTQIFEIEPEAEGEQAGQPGAPEGSGLWDRFKGWVSGTSGRPDWGIEEGSVVERGRTLNRQAQTTLTEGEDLLRRHAEQFSGTDDADLHSRAQQAVGGWKREGLEELARRARAGDAQALAVFRQHPDLARQFGVNVQEAP